MRNREILGEIELGGGPVYYLDDMKSVCGEDRALERCPQTPPLETAVLGPDDFDAMRISMVLARLDSREQAIVLAKGQPDGKRAGGLSWEKAAQEVGATEKDGRRVRAKAMRVAAQIMAELENAAEVDGALR